MANLTIEVQDDLVRRLEGIAATQRKSVQQLALERLISLVDVITAILARSPTVVLREMREPPHPSSADIDELDAAIEGRRLPVRTRDLCDVALTITLAGCVGASRNGIPASEINPGERVKYVTFTEDTLAVDLVDGRGRLRHLLARYRRRLK